MSLRKGLHYTWITIVLWSLEMVFSRVAVVKYEVNTLLYANLSVLCAAVSLLTIGGRGERSLATLKSIYSWAYGGSQILMNIFFMYTLTLVSTTELSFLMRLVVIIQLGLVWLLSRKAPSTSDWPGLIVILLSCLVIFSNVPDDILVATILGSVLAAAFAAGRMTLAELHPLYQPKDSIRQRCRITGYVLLVTSSVVFAGLFAMDWLQTSFSLSLISTPKVEMLLSPELYLLSFIGGGLLLAPAFYFFFYACQTIKAENFALYAAFLPFTTFAVEYCVVYFDLLPLSGLTVTDVAAGIVGIFGSVLILLGRRRKPLIKAA